MLFTISCNKDEFDFQGSTTDPIETVEVKDGNVIHTIDEGVAASIMYYNFVGGKLDNIKAEAHYKDKKAANAAYDLWEMMTSAEEKNLMSVKKDGKVIKIDYLKGNEEYEFWGDFTAEQLAAALKGDINYEY